MAIGRLLAVVIVLIAVVGGFLWYSGKLKVSESGSIEVTAPEVSAPSVEETDPFKRGFSNYAFSKYESAITELKGAIEKDPNNPKVAEARYMIAKCYDDLNKTSEAVTAFKEYLKLHANDPSEKERAQQARKRVGLLSGTGTFDN